MAVKRGRGRPRLPRPEVEVPKRPRGRPATAKEYVEIPLPESSSGMSSDELEELKYRRMRDLNNAASKRCRNSRKRKFQDKEEEITLLAARNIEMKGIVEELESEIKKFKSALDSMIKKSKIQHVQDDSMIKNDKNQQVQEDSTKTNKSLATASKSNTSEFDP